MRSQGAFYTHTRNFSQISKRFERQKDRLLFFGASAFHSDCDWCLVSLGGVEFAVFSKPLDAEKVPVLLDEVHWLMENKKLRFILCGSSARKLRRGHANLLVAVELSAMSFTLSARF